MSRFNSSSIIFYIIIFLVFYLILQFFGFAFLIFGGLIRIFFRFWYVFLGLIAWSYIYNVEEEKGVASQIPAAVNVNTLFANLKANPGATIRLYDRAGIERKQGPLDFEDFVLVTSANLTVEKQYQLNFIGEILGSEAYITSDTFNIIQETFTIDSILLHTPIQEFLDHITAAPYASVVILDLSMSPTASKTLDERHSVLVRSGDALTEVVYTINFYEPVSIHGIESMPISIYPNPANNHITIDGLAPQSTIKVLNIHGSIVYESSNENSEELDLSLVNLSPGVYFIRVTNSRYISCTHKIVKEK